MATKKRSSVRVPRRAEGIRIAYVLSPTQHRMLHGFLVTTCTSADELRPTFSIGGIRYDGPIAALRQLGKCVPVGDSERLYPEDNEAACQVDNIVGITDSFLSDYMAAAMNEAMAEQGKLAGDLNRAFVKLLGVIYPGTPQAEGDCFCVGRTLTIADLQVYAVFAVLDAVAVDGFNSVLFPEAHIKAAVDHGRKIASHEMIQAGKQYYLDNGSDI